MSGVIENFLLVGIQAAILIIATLIFRRVLKNTPKVFVYAMWMVVLLRLCVPITTESRLGLIDRQEIKPVVENTESLDTPEFMEDNNENIVENPTITVPSVPQKQPVKLIEQLYQDGHIPQYMFKNILNEHRDIVDITEFNLQRKDK